MLICCPAGMAALLDHAERGHAAVAPLALSILADLLEHSTLAHACFRDWLSDRSQRTAPELLLQIWREAEAETGVTTGGVLTALHRPLAGTGKRALWLPPHEVRHHLAAMQAVRPSAVVPPAFGEDMHVALAVVVADGGTLRKG